MVICELAERYGWKLSEILEMPENIVVMYAADIHRRKVIDSMNECLKAGGEDAIKKMPSDAAERKMYLKIRNAQREAEMIEHKKIKEKFQRLNNGK